MERDCRGTLEGSLDVPTHEMTASQQTSMLCGMIQSQVYGMSSITRLDEWADEINQYSTVYADSWFSKLPPYDVLDWEN